MHMRRARMRDGFAGIAVGMEMDDAAVMAVAMEMQTVAPQPMCAKPDQHDADRRLERPSQTFRDGVIKQDGRAGKDEQRQRMASPQVSPCLTMSPTSLR